jgi:hypothetical protein
MNTQHNKNTVLVPVVRSSQQASTQKHKRHEPKNNRTEQPQGIRSH